MVKKGNEKGFRSFTVVDASKHGGCSTKFMGGRYVSRNPFGAAKKAFSELCRVKNIRGVCSLVITLKETTEESNKKVFTYKLNRKKLKNPIIRLEGTKNEFLIQYVVTGKSVDSKGTCKKKGKSKGIISRATKGKRKSVNNLKKSKNWNNMKKLLSV